ncbi:conserved hypothetical protein [Trichinella spiralis]|uniref:hypothetical protein n=1 Tax=Trichinella spiralis TaxID=6334 RepID=UPI0001EFC0AE|nr:conserved hypothetical protein [Trichinella spiralis]
MIFFVAPTPFVDVDRLLITHKWRTNADMEIEEFEAALTFLLGAVHHFLSAFEMLHFYLSMPLIFITIVESEQYHGIHCLGHRMNPFEKASVCSIVKIPHTNTTVCFVLVHFSGICQKVFGSLGLYQGSVKIFSDVA